MKELAGNPGKRAINRDEPKPPPGIPDCPAHLTSDARREWDRIVAVLAKMGLLTTADRSALAAYCASYGRWAAAERKLKRGLTYKSKDLIKTHPAVNIAHNAMVLMHKYLSEFGLSPASRSRLGTEGPSQDDEFETFVSATGS